MRLIDTSSWIEAMRRDGDPGVRARVGGLMSRGEAAWCDMVLLELWNGVRGSAERTLLDSLAADVVLLPMTDGAWDRARQLARRSRAGGLTVRIEDGAGCPQYAAAVISGLTVGPSPAWLRDAVESVGGRSINNLVDATNYLLHGFGQAAGNLDFGPRVALPNFRTLLICLSRFGWLFIRFGSDFLVRQHST